jgi:DNA-binding SARP family transcriptional activator/Tfp pilus assembly protein PilF
MRCINVLGGLYLTAEQRPLTGAATQPMRLAVLALLAVAGERAVTREQFLTYLWPDLDDERGRHALTQSLYALRRALDAEELFLGQQELRLNPDLITSDFAEFHAAIRSDNPERAVECYRGPFLAGFHLPRADQFARWVDEQRETLEQEYGRALEAAARRASNRREFTAAAGYLKLRAAQDPLNGKVAARLMEALAAQGAVVAALQHGRAHEALVKQELGLAPDPEVTAVAERIRTAPRAGPPPSPAEVPAPAPPSAPEPAPALAAAAIPQPHSTKRRWVVPGTIALVLLAAGGLAIGSWRRHSRLQAERERPVVAVGLIADYSGTRPGGLGLPLADMLATNLARGSGFRVISNARMLELTRQLRDNGDSNAGVAAAARQAGAAELIDGSLYSVAPNRYRLDLRRVDLVTGAVLRAYRAEGSDFFALVDSGTAGLVPDVGGAAPEGSLAEASTMSVQAYQLYEEGLRRYYDHERVNAERLFHQALEIDTGFAQAAFYYALSTTSGSRTETLDRLKRALDLSPRATDRERLVIRADWFLQTSSPELAAVAESLMLRYPAEIDGYSYAAQGEVRLGHYLAAEAPFRRVLQLDSLEVTEVQTGRCRTCEAFAGLSYIYMAMDSMDRVRATIRGWVRHQPDRAQAWHGLAVMYAQDGKLDSSLAALRVADSLQPFGANYLQMQIAMRSAAGDYAGAERLLRTEVESGPVISQGDAKWDLAVTLRQMGRLREALRLAHEYRMGIKERLPPGAAPYNALLEAQIHFELGEPRVAAALFDSIAVGQESNYSPSLQSRDRIWAWVHEADALVQLGDTTRLRLLADSMEILGRSVAHARDQVLHAHVRGLLARLRDQDEQAIEWFRRAIVSPVFGFTRSNYELAGVYLRTRRWAEAIAILRSALHGSLIDSNLYITQPELQARLAEAFDSAGVPDSARWYYAKVVKYWEHADPQLWPRRDSLEVATRRLAAAGR